MSESRQLPDQNRRDEYEGTWVCDTCGTEYTSNIGKCGQLIPPCDGTVHPKIEREGDRLLSVTMTADAARAFWKALVWASGQADEQGRDEHYEWLSWGAGRVSTAQSVRKDGP